MSSGKTPWKSIAILLIAIAAGLVAYDIQLHGTFQKSVTGRVLKDYGVLAAWNQSRARANVYYKQSRNWINKNGPVYYAKVDKVIGPYVAIIKEKVLLGLGIVWDALLPLRQWTNKTLPPIWDNINRNYVPKLVEIANRSIHALQLILIDIGLWIQTNVLTGSLSVENLQKLLVTYTTKAQESASDAYMWVAKRLQA